MEKIKKAAGFWLAVSLYAPMQLVAPRAVTIAVAILAIIFFAATREKFYAHVRELYFYDAKVPHLHCG